MILRLRGLFRSLYHVLCFFFLKSCSFCPVKSWFRLQMSADIKRIFCSNKHWNTRPFRSAAAKETNTTNTKLMRQLQFEPELALPVPHSVIIQLASRCGPGNCGERPRVNGDVRHVLLQWGHVSCIHNTEHVQQAQQGEHLSHITGKNSRVHLQNSDCKEYTQSKESRDLRESSEVNLVAATQWQMQQILQLFEHQETVSHQQSAVTVAQEKFIGADNDNS